MVGPHRPTLRFSLKRLLISTTLIAVGVAGLTQCIRHPPANDLKLVEWWAGSGAIIGSGILNIFGKLWVGVLLGGIISVVFLIALAILFSPFLGI